MYLTGIRNLTRRSMSSREQVIQEAVDEAYRLYGASAFGEVRQLTNLILQKDENNFDGLYLNGLAACWTGDPIVGARQIRRASEIRPNVDKFDHMDAWVRQQGNRAQVHFWEKRLEEFRKISQIDNLILSYPKCGRTWVRYVLGVYGLNGNPGDPLMVGDISLADPSLPVTEFTHDDNPHWKPFGDIVRDKSMYEGKRIVFLARDPRDALVSYYFQYTKRGDRKHANDFDFDGDLPDFLRHPIGGLRSIVAFYNAWAENRTVPDAFHLLKYEDLRADPEPTFRELLSFLGWPDHGDDAVEAAVSAGEFSKMKKLEATDALKNERLKPPEDGDPEGFKVRKGKVGGYREYFTEDDKEYVDAFLRDELDDFFGCYKNPNRTER